MTNYSTHIDQLYKNHQSWLYQWLRKKVGDPDQALDIVQDTFIKILQTRNELFGVKEPRAYLTSIAKNLLIDQVRRKKIELAYLDGLKQMEHMLETVASPEEQLEVIQAINQLCKALDGDRDNLYVGYTTNYLKIVFEGSEDMIGKLVKVKITKAGYPYNKGQFVRVLEEQSNQSAI